MPNRAFCSCGMLWTALLTVSSAKQKVDASHGGYYVYARIRIFCYCGRLLQSLGLGVWGVMLCTWPSISSPHLSSHFHNRLGCLVWRSTSRSNRADVVLCHIVPSCVSCRCACEAEHDSEKWQVLVLMCSGATDVLLTRPHVKPAFHIGGGWFGCAVMPLLCLVRMLLKSCLHWK